MKKCLRCNLAYNEQKFVQCPKCYPFSKDGTSVRCPRCQELYLSSHPVCPVCSEKRPPRNDRFCVHCAHQLPPKKTVCTNHNKQTDLRATRKRRRSSHSKKSHFSALPGDLVHRISEFLPHPSDLYLSQVNRDIRWALKSRPNFLHNTAVLLEETNPRIPPPPPRAGNRSVVAICGNYYVFFIDATPDFDPYWPLQDTTPDFGPDGLLQDASPDVISPSEQITLWDMRTRTSHKIRGSRLFCVLPGPQKLVTLCYQKRDRCNGFNTLFLLTYSLNRDALYPPSCVSTGLDVSMDVDQMSISLFPADNDRFVVYYITKNNITKKNTLHYQLYASNGLVLEENRSCLSSEGIELHKELYLADGKLVADYGYEIRIVDVKKMEKGLFDVAAVDILPQIPNALALLAVHNQYIAVECYGNELKIWDCNNGNFVFPCTTNTYGVASLINTTAMWEERGNMYIVTTMSFSFSAPSRIVIWNLNRNEPVCCLVNQDKSYFHALNDMTIEYDKRLKLIIINRYGSVYVFQRNVSA